MELHDLLTMGSEDLGAVMDKMLSALPPVVYQRVLINGGTKRHVGSIRKLRLSYKRYRAKLKRGSWVLKGLKDELWGVTNPNIPSTFVNEKEPSSQIVP